MTPPRAVDPTVLVGARAWFVVLLVGLAGWWAVVVAVPGARPHFFPAGTLPSSLWAFAVPDLFLVALPTLYALRQLRTAPSQARWTSWLVTGALGYSALWSLGASLWAWEAPLGPLVMLACAFFQAVVGWTLQPTETWFRVAEPASVAVRALKTVADAGLFTGAFLVVAPVLLRLVEDTYGLPRWPLLPLGPVVAIIAALNLAGLFAGLRLVRDGEGTPLPVDTAAKLVVSGVYAHIRNPMAALGIAQGLLLAVGLGSPLTLAYALFGGVFWHGFVRPIEEHDLHRRFGDDYRRYAEQVPLWWPRLRPYAPADSP